MFCFVAIFALFLKMSLHHAGFSHQKHSFMWKGSKLFQHNQATLALTSRLRSGKHTKDIHQQVKVFQCPMGEWQSSECERELVTESPASPERVWSLVNSPDTASWNSSSLRALRGEDPLTTDCSSSWCSVARVCSASERILFFSTSCSNFRLRTWARHTQTHTHTHTHTHTNTNTNTNTHTHTHTHIQTNKQKETNHSQKHTNMNYIFQIWQLKTNKCS